MSAEESLKEEEESIRMAPGEDRQVKTLVIMMMTIVISIMTKMMITRLQEAEDI